MNKKEYLEKQQKLLEKEPLIEVEMPSGDIWKHRPFDFIQYATAVQFPMHLIGKLKSAQNQPSKELSEEEALKIADKAMRLVGDIMLTKLVEPKVAVKETEEAMTVDQLNPTDFAFFRDYILSGGQATQNSFRKRSTGK